MSEAVKVSDKKNLLIPVAVIIALIAIIAAVYFFVQYQKTQNLLANPNISAQQEVKSLVAKVGNLIELPAGEDPTVATVSDKTKLADQPFFANAENGDKVLIYTKAKKAILYRPSTNKIIEVAPVNLGNNTTTQNPSPTASPKTFKVVLLNGTTTIGLTNVAEKTLTSKLSNVQITNKDNAAKSDYTKTVVVDLNNNPSEAQSIAQVLGGAVGALPSGETKPTGVDFLVILAK